MASSSEKNISKNRKKSSEKKAIGRRNISKAAFIRAIAGSGGIVSQIAERLKCSRKTVYTYIEKYPEVKAAYDDEKETILDVCEEGLFAKIYGQDFEAIKYYLERKGKSRGYGGQDQFGKGPEDNDGGGLEYGVLVAPGLLEDEAWEKAAAQE